MPDNPKREMTQSRFWLQFGRPGVDDGRVQTAASAGQPPSGADGGVRQLPGGTIFVGISDRRPRQILGVQWTQDLVEQIQEAARSTQPPLPVEVEPWRVDDRDIASIQVRALARGWVETSDGRLLVRAGPTNRALVGDELLRFVRERAADPVEDEPVPGIGLDDLRPELVRQSVRARMPGSRVSLSAAVRDLGLLTSDGQVRLATLLMFGREPQYRNRRFGIVVSRFEGSANGAARLRDRRELV